MTEIGDYILGLEDEEFRLIGKVTAHGAYLEYRLHTAVWYLLGFEDPNDGLIVSGKLNARTLVQMFRELCAMRFASAPGLKSEAQELATRADAAMEDRNNVVHGVWLESIRELDTGSETYVMRMIVRLRMKKETKKHPYWMGFDESELSKIAEDLFRTASAIEQFTFRHVEKMKPQRP
jgi:hypothetical protein